MPVVDIQDAAAQLDAILGDYADLVEQAEGFGLRLGAMPKNLMPLAEAQRIVKDMGAKKEELSNFLSGVYLAARKVPKEVGAEYEALIKKGQKAIDKITVDLKKAEAAIQKYEELLLGENFQSWFEMVRMAIIDLDIPEGIYLDFRSELKTDENPPFAYGVVSLEKGREVLYKVIAGYKAQGDLYWGNITVLSTGKTYKNVVKFEGRRGLRGGAKTLAEQLLALVQAGGKEGLFGTRRNVSLDIKDSSTLGPLVAKGIMDYVQGKWFGEPASVIWAPTLFLDESLKTGRGAIKVDQAFPKRTFSAVTAVLGKGALFYRRVEKPFVVQVGDLKWKVTVTRGADQGFSAYCNPSPKDSRYFNAYYYWYNLTGCLSCLEQAAAKNPHILTMKPTKVVGLMNVKVEMMRARKTSSTRVAERYLMAGASGCEETVWIADEKQAWQEALGEAAAKHGDRGYSGGMAEKRGCGYEVVQREPVTLAELDKIVNDNWDRFDEKWGPAGAVPLLSRTPDRKEALTVEVKASNERDALRQGGLMIRATGHIAVGVRVQVQDLKAKMLPGGARVKTFQVSGVRVQFKRGIAGWHFFGWCSS